MLSLCHLTFHTTPSASLSLLSEGRLFTMRDPPVLDHIRLLNRVNSQSSLFVWGELLYHVKVKLHHHIIVSRTEREKLKQLIGDIPQLPLWVEQRIRSASIQCLEVTSHLNTKTWEHMWCDFIWQRCCLKGQDVPQGQKDEKRDWRPSWDGAQSSLLHYWICTHGFIHTRLQTGTPLGSGFWYCDTH